MSDYSRDQRRLRLHEKNRLSYDAPAENWLEALPLGNGQTAAMLWGGVLEEELNLNHACFWSGFKRAYEPQGGPELLAKIRGALAKGEYGEADALSAGLMGAYTATYLPLANLRIQFHRSEADSDVAEVEGYSRTLDLKQALAQSRFSLGGAHYRREAFISAPADMLLMKWTSDAPEGLRLSLRFDSPIAGRCELLDDGLAFEGFAPEQLLPGYLDENQRNQGVPADEHQGLAQRARALCWVKAPGARFEKVGESLMISGARELDLRLLVACSYQRPEEAREVLYYRERPSLDRSAWNRERREDLTKMLDTRLLRSKAFSYKELKEEHLADYARYYERVQLQLPEALPCTTSLAFNYGRYLFISSSRPKGQAPNLQGLWNKELYPPWSSNYTTNINAEMNYWSAEVCNLSELHQPLLQLTKELAESGREVAEKLYGMRGWVLHHNTDLWRQCWPVGAGGHGQANWAIWPMAGLWLCQHLWEHYAFSRDVIYLRDFALPIMASALEFVLDWLYEGAAGPMCSGPSSSPEHRFYHQSKLVGLSEASSMDGQLIRELATNFQRACALSGELCADGTDYQRLSASAAALLEKLPRAGIDESGVLMEWEKDFSVEDVHHRHLSHLYSLYPGCDYQAGQNPVHFAAAKQALERRGDEATGWGLGWRACLWARLGEAERAEKILQSMLRPLPLDAKIGSKAGIYPNLFSAHPPFQIDGNFAFTAAVAEMLLQSHQGYVELLPALPKKWAEKGSFSGLKARGNFTVSCRWENACIKSARFRAAVSQHLRLYLGETEEAPRFYLDGQELTSALSSTKAPAREGRLYELELAAGSELRLEFKKRPNEAGG